MNIYLPEDLAADIKAELGEANISGIAQNALRAELARARGQVLADKHGFQRVEAVDGDEEVAFQGRKIGRDYDQNRTAYLTPMRIPIESVHPFRSNPYSGSGVFVHLAGWL
jgi:hypothetical protein